MSVLWARWLQSKLMADHMLSWLLLWALLLARMTWRAFSCIGLVSQDRAKSGNSPHLAGTLTQTIRMVQVTLSKCGQSNVCITPTPWAGKPTEECIAEI